MCVHKSELNLQYSHKPMRSVTSTMNFPNPLLSKRHNIPSILVVVLLLIASTIGVTAVPAPYELTSKQIADFCRDGVIVVRGMLEGEDLKDALAAAEKIQRSQGWAQKLLYKIFPIYKNLDFQAYQKHKALKNVAFDSSAPTICAKLMGLNGEATAATDKPWSLRLLKEAVMGMGKGDRGCGWHVDNKTFWPCEDSHDDNLPKSTKTQHNKLPRDAGINVWITLSPLTKEQGGGLAVAPGSHNLTGKGRVGKLVQKARRAIASKGPQTTCALAKLEPTCHEYMEKCKRVYDLQPGDAIIHDRYIFHRSDNFCQEVEEGVTKQRILLCYMPSDATFFNNGSETDGAVNHKNLQTGDPLWKAEEYFPQVWPSQLEAEAKAKPKRDVNPLGTKVLIRIAKMMITPKPKAAKAN